MGFFLTAEELNSKTYEVIGAALEVHKNLGFGFLEKVYENALAVELQKRGIPFKTQQKICVHYSGKIVGDYTADILIDDWLLLELKATKAISDSHKSQCVNYLTALNLDVCLLINFGAPKLETQRFVARNLLSKIKDSQPEEKFLIKKINQS